MKCLKALGLLAVIATVIQIYIPLIEKSIWLSTHYYIVRTAPFYNSYGDVAKSTAFGLVWLITCLLIPAMLCAWLAYVGRLYGQHRQERRERMFSNGTPLAA